MDVVTTKVKLDGTYVGDIRGTKDAGYAYFPKGSKVGGELLPTILDVMQSIEAE